MRRLLRENGLSLAMFGFFLLSLVALVFTGHANYNEEQQEHGQPAVGVPEYLTTGAFVEAVFENWESEFLQMGSYVLLTAYLFQKGSPESKKLNRDEPVDREPLAGSRDPKVPFPVRVGGLLLGLYKHSLSIALFGLFFLSFALHAIGGAEEYSEDQRAHGGEPVTTIEYLTTSRFWFESFQNWQSEFLAVGGLIVLAIFLREKGSPESKPVDAPHFETGQT